MKLVLKDPGLHTKTVEVADEAEAERFLNAEPQNHLWTTVLMKAQDGTRLWTRALGERKWYKCTIWATPSIQKPR